MLFSVIYIEAWAVQKVNGNNQKNAVKLYTFTLRQNKA